MRMGLFGFKRKLADSKNVLLVQCSLGGERTNQNPRFLSFILFIYFFASHYLHFSLSFMFCPRVVLVCLTNPESIPSIYPPREFPRDGSTITWCLSPGTAGHSMFVIWIINRKNHPLKVSSEQTDNVMCLFHGEKRVIQLESVFGSKCFGIWEKECWLQLVNYPCWISWNYTFNICNACKAL